MNLLVDPVIFAMPSQSAPQAVREQFFRHLQNWSVVQRTGTHNLFVAQSCMYALYEAHCFPDLRALRNLWLMTPEETIDPQTLFTACKRLFMNLPYLEDRVPRLRSVCVDEAHVEVMPDLVQRLCKPLARAFREALGLVGYAKMSNQEEVAEDMLLITHPMNGSSTAEIRAPVEHGEHCFIAEADLPLITSPEDLDSFLGLSEIWPETDRAIKFIHRTMVDKHYLDAGSQLREFRVAQGFSASIRDCQCEKLPGRLRQVFLKCAQLLSDSLPYDAHTHHGLGRPKQHKKGDWRAWRLHITGRPSSLRLHYWRSGNEYLLMQVGPHENYYIGHPSEAGAEVE